MRLAQYIAQVHTSESTGHEQSRANSVKAHTMRLNARENCVGLQPQNLYIRPKTKQFHHHVRDSS